MTLLIFSEKTSGSLLISERKRKTTGQLENKSHGARKTASSSASAEVCSAPWAGLSDSLHLRGTALTACTQPACTLHQPPAQPQPCSSSNSRGWLQPRPRWSSQPCRSQSPWASLTPPWITTQSWRRWWCSALQGPPSSPPPHPKVQALAPGSQVNSTTTLLEVRAEDLLLVLYAACKAEFKIRSHLLSYTKPRKELRVLNSCITLLFFCCVLLIHTINWYNWCNNSWHKRIFSYKSILICFIMACSEKCYA